jgi:hypothetical protein
VGLKLATETWTIEKLIETVSATNQDTTTGGSLIPTSMGGAHEFGCRLHPGLL